MDDLEERFARYAQAPDNCWFGRDQMLLEISDRLKRYREALEDALAFFTGEISGSSQRSGIIAEIRQALHNEVKP